MREIKFRAWDTETKEMSYDFLSRNWILVCIESPHVELMQYTGLKDENGKEIYEGDIIVVENGKYSGTVKFNEEDLSYVIENETGGFGFVNGQTYDKRPEFKTYEVIGNIYESPELAVMDS